MLAYRDPFLDSVKSLPIALVPVRNLINLSALCSVRLFASSVFKLRAVCFNKMLRGGRGGAWSPCKQGWL